jgi:hypothetical protein
MIFTIANDKVRDFRALIETYMTPPVTALKYHTSGSTTTIAVPDTIIAELKAEELEKLRELN